MYISVVLYYQTYLFFSLFKLLCRKHFEYNESFGFASILSGWQREMVIFGVLAGWDGGIGDILTVCT
jgi:hypothetical protein